MSCSVLTADPFAGFRTAMTSTTAAAAPTGASEQKESLDPLVNFGSLCGALPEGKDYSCLLPPNIPIDDREELGSCASTTAAAPLSASLTKDPTSPVADCLEGAQMLPITQPANDTAPVTKTAPATPVTPTIATPSPIANNASPITKQSPPLAPAKPSYLPSAPVGTAGIPFSHLQPQVPSNQNNQQALAAAQPRPAPFQASAAPQPVHAAAPVPTAAFTARQVQQQPAMQQQYVLQQYQAQVPTQVPQTAVPAGYYQVAQAPQVASQPMYYATSNGYYYPVTTAQPAALQQAAMQMSVPSSSVYYGIQNPATGQIQYVTAAQPAQQAYAPSAGLQQQYAVLASPQGFTSAGQPTAQQHVLTYNTATGATSYAVPSAQSVYYVQQQPMAQPASVASPSVAYYTYGPAAVRR